MISVIHFLISVLVILYIYFKILNTKKYFQISHQGPELFKTKICLQIFHQKPEIFNAKICTNISPRTKKVQCKNILPGTRNIQSKYMYTNISRGTKKYLMQKYIYKYFTRDQKYSMNILPKYFCMITLKDFDHKFFH